MGEAVCIIHPVGSAPTLGYMRGKQKQKQKQGSHHHAVPQVLRSLADLHSSFILNESYYVCVYIISRVFSWI